MKLSVFLKKCFSKYADRYDYSKITSISKKVPIICHLHGEFLQSPNRHLKCLHGCPACAKQATIHKKTTPLSSFIEKANKRHNNKYNYSLTSFKTLKDEIQVICPVHGVFCTKAANHLKHGCIQCRDQACRDSLEQFLNKAKRLHNNKYDYSQVTSYTNNKQKINVICNNHGPFTIRIDAHLQGRGCKLCYKNATKNKYLLEFIRKAELIHYKYDYSNLKAKDFNYKKIPIICPKHGKFKQIPWQHLRGHGCFQCSQEDRRLTISDFLQQAKQVHQDKYDYSKVSFQLVTDKIIINCYKHGQFTQRLSAHIYGKQGCPYCSKLVSKQEKEWLDSIGLPMSNRNVRVTIGDRVFFPDGFDADKKIFYEFYGDYWHGNLKVYSPDDINKLNKVKFIELYHRTMEREEFIKSYGYQIVSMWESDWNQR